MTSIQQNKYNWIFVDYQKKQTLDIKKYLNFSVKRLLIKLDTYVTYIYLKFPCCRKPIYLANL